MADKLTSIKIKQKNGSYTSQIPIGVSAQNVQWDGTHSLLDILGSVDINTGGKGNVQHQFDDIYQNINNFTDDINTEMTDFTNSTNQSITNFTNSTNQNFADFTSTTNQNITNFTNSTNQNFADFTSTTNQNITNFTNSTNQNFTDFTNATNQNITNFTNSTNQNFTDFTNATNQHLSDVLGDISTETKGTVQAQMDKLQNDMNTFYTQMTAEIGTDVSDWLQQNVTPAGSMTMVDNSLTISDAAADAKTVGDAITSLNGSLSNKVGYIHSSATVLKNCDLDDIITPGSYRVTSISNAKTVTNIPEEQGGVLLVSIMQAKANVWQRYIVLTANNGVRIYDRVQLSGTWKSWFDNTTSFDNAKKLSINNDDYISIQSGSDLNDITTVGSYKSISSSVTATLLNKPPINVGFLLLVSNVTSNSVFLQVAIDASPTSLVFLRYINPTGDVFGEWHKIQYDDIGIESTLASMGNSITSNTSRIATLEAQSGIEGNYYTPFEEQEQALYDKVNNDIDKNTLVFLVSADNHYRETKPEGEHQVYHAEVMAKIAKRLRVDAIINLGDIITQYFDSIDDPVYSGTGITAEEVNTMRLAKMATAFQSTGVPFLYTLAHHEMSLHNNGPTSTDNTTQTSVYPYPESKVLGLCGKGAEWLEEHHYSQDPLSAGYYVDFARHKVRLIFIDSVSYSAVGFSPNSIAFITEAFSNVPSGYKVIVCSHAATRGPGVYSSTMKNWEPVENIMSNFVSNGGTILAVLHGHDHYDNVVFIENVPYPYISICCAENSWSTVSEKIAAGVQGNPVSYKAHSATRGAAIGTYNEWLFDVMCVHPDRNTINFFRFGIGEDRTVSLSET